MNKIFSFSVAFLFVLITASGYSQSINDKVFKNVLMTELKKHPRLQVDDLYKFIHQASFGSEHAVKDTSGVRNWMEREVANLDFTFEDGLIDTLSSDGRIVRVNLRPFLKAGYDPELLLDAFVKTANNYKGSVETFKSYWSEAVELAEEEHFSFTKTEMYNLFVEMSARGFPALHHSPEYVKEYKPAYRVVDLDYLKFLFR